MIAELERIIRAEEAKPEAERDLALIDDCIKEIAEIKGVKAEFSEEEVAQITDKLIQTAEKTKKRKRFVRLAAGIAAAVVLVTGITACTINPALINWFKMIVRMPFGAAVEQETITYIHQGSSDEFSNIEELLSYNNLDVYYPSVLPESTKLKSIEILEENGSQILSFFFTSAGFRYTIQLSNPNYRWEQEIISVIEKDSLSFDVNTEGDHYISHSAIDGNTYIIQADTINDIILVIGGLRKVKG